MNTYDERTGASIRFLREQSGISQAELAELLGVKVKTVIKLEENGMIPGETTVKRLALIFGVPAESFSESADMAEIEANPSANPRALLNERRTRYVSFSFLYVISAVLIVLARLIHKYVFGSRDFFYGKMSIDMSAFAAALFCFSIITIIYFCYRNTFNRSKRVKTVVAISAVVLFPILLLFCVLFLNAIYFLFAIETLAVKSEYLALYFKSIKAEKKRISSAIYAFSASVLICAVSATVLPVLFYTISTVIVTDIRTPVIKVTATEYKPASSVITTETKVAENDYYLFEYPSDFTEEPNADNTTSLRILSNSEGESFIYMTYETTAGAYHFGALCEDVGATETDKYLKEFFIDKVGFFPDTEYNLLAAFNIDDYDDFNLLDPLQCTYMSYARIWRDNYYFENAKLYRGKDFNAFISNHCIKIFPDYDKNASFIILVPGESEFDYVLNSLTFKQ